MLQEHGFELVPALLNEQQLFSLRDQLAVETGAGQRGLLSHPAVSELARSPSIIALMSRHLGGQATPVRAILFDKSNDTNWLVPWHQDLTIAVMERADVEGYGPWSVKDGVPHVQPPVGVLRQMLTIRIHLDDCDATNGPLQVIPGSHKAGRLDSAAIQDWRACVKPVLCEAKAGDALLMRPLLLHASSRSTAMDRHRRVLHIEYAACELASPLRWHGAELEAAQ